MKKNIIIAAIAAASALLLSVSCQKESQPESQNGINGGAKTFTATIEQGLTKTTITSANKVNWKTNDEININGKVYTAAPKVDATKADFTAKNGEASADNGKYKAIYPSTLYVTDHFELPAVQEYTAGEFNAPMYAESETTTLSFKNICAVLAITVTSADIPTLKSIKVKSDKKLNGTFTVASTTDGYTAVIGTDGTEQVVLTSNDALTLDVTGTTFYIAIPAQEYSYLKIYLSEDGTLYKRAMITKKAAGLGTIACNTIYNINYETNAVQMYADGPYWSTMNLGAATETEYGAYYVWGATVKAYSAVDYTKDTDAFTFVTSNPYGDIYKNTWSASDGFSWNNTPFTNGVYSSGSKNVFTKYVPEANKSEYGDGSTFFDNKNILDLADDAAAVNWGAAWKMPTGGGSGLFKALNDNTTNAWVGTGVNGRKFTGKDPYSDITLFFPAAGYGNNTSLYDAGSSGYYWSSSLSTGDTVSACRLYFGSGYVIPQSSGSRYGGFSVRPVSD